MAPSDITLEKTLPHNIEAERAVLGGILVHPPALFDAQEVITTDSFYLEAHRAAFNAMLSLNKSDSPIDLITIKNELQKTDSLEKCGGAAYLFSLTDGIPTAINVRHWAGIIKECATKRRIIQLANEAMSRSYLDEDKAKEIIETLQMELLKLSQSDKGKGFKPVKEFVESAYRDIQDTAEKKISASGLDTGFRQLNYLTQGFKPGELIIVAGRPGHGKSSLAQNIVDNLVLNRQKCVGVFSLEMSGQELAKRSICAETPLDSYEIPAGHLNWLRIGEVCERLEKSGLHIDESAGLTIYELRVRAQRLAVQNHLDLIVVDYLQLMSGSGRKSDNREREISEISRGLKVLAKDLQVPVIALSQLNREIEKTNRMPMLSDLRESGAIEQDADVVLFIWREEMRTKSESNEGEAKLILAKQRNGKSAQTVELQFDKRYCRFRDV